VCVTLYLNPATVGRSVKCHMWHSVLPQSDFRSSIRWSSVHVQKAFDPTYLRHLKSRSWLLFNFALLLHLIHGSRYCRLRYVVTFPPSLSALFNRVYTFGPSCCLTNLVTPPLSYSPRAYQVLHSRRPAEFVKISRCHLLYLSHSSYPLALILLPFIFVVLYIHMANRSIQASQEFSP
jgi:hypothetical protein